MKATVFYDGQCPFCLKSIGILQNLDWLKRLDYKDAHNWQITCITPEQLLEEMHLMTPDGSIYHGFVALRHIAWRLPLLWPLAPLMHIPGISWLGQRIYLWVARNRSCKDGVCKL